MRPDSKAVTLILLLLPASLFGQPTQSTAPPDGAVLSERIHAVEGGLQMPVTIRGRGGMPIAERMSFHNVPGASVAVINGGRVEWARGYGVKEAGTSDSVASETLFQAASLSKPVTALAALRLVREGRLALDGDVNRSLVSWKIPGSAFTRNRKVTLRDILTHRSGLTNSIGAYAPDVHPVPTHVEALDGSSPLKPRAVRVEFEPGSRFEYSGGGFSVLQLLLEDVTGRRFAEFMHDTVLGPLGMQRSFFSQPLPDELERFAASGHGPDGSPMPGRWRVLPEAAAGGLWSTASDLARFAIELQEAVAGSSSRIIDSPLATQMLTPELRDWGLGISIRGQGAARYFTHTGWNRGYRSLLIGFVETGQGAVIMTNGDSRGTELISEIVLAIAQVYDWAVLRSRERTAVAMDPGIHPGYVGRYQIEPGLEFTVASDGSRLFISGGPLGSRNVELYRESTDTYFPLVTDVAFTFRRDERGVVTGLLVQPPEADAQRLATKVGG
ncbi:MAG TPA: serine hydrolase [Gemmatimonadaceae bacterium]|nr:serine hydrolase [Gemmatimonadaceae bacterium]